jgi:RecA-family ATPase
VRHAGKQLSDLAGIRLVPMAGQDAVLAEPDRKGMLTATPIFAKLEAETRSLRPKLVVIDPSADVFGGDEINRSQVRKFVSMLRGLAIDFDCAVLLLSHPSLTGLNSGTGTSGSTAWNNSVRSRLYLEVVDKDPDARVLKVVKANYGRVGEFIAMRWDDGVYALDNGPDPVMAKVLNKSADDVFMAVFSKFTAQAQALGPNVGPSYAPKKIFGHPDAKGYSKADLAAAMQRLLDSGRLKIEVTGPPSRRYTQLVAALN